MMIKINRQQLKKLNDKKLLKLTRKTYQLYEENLVSEFALHYFINEVSGRHYGFEDVNATTWVGEFLCFSNNGTELVKMVKINTAIKFFENGDVGDVIIPVATIGKICDDNGDLLFFTDDFKQRR